MAGPDQPAVTRRRTLQGRAARQLGIRAEQVAERFLRAQGVEILYRNFRRRLGELDLVARHAGELIIVEVRTRSTERFGGAAASIDSRKKQRVVRATQLLLQRYKELAQMRVRFDVVIVYNVHSTAPRVEWLRAAFLAS